MLAMCLDRTFHKTYERRSLYYLENVFDFEKLFSFYHCFIFYQYNLNFPGFPIFIVEPVSTARPSLTRKDECGHVQEIMRENTRSGYLII